MLLNSCDCYCSCRDVVLLIQRPSWRFECSFGSYYIKTEHSKSSWEGVCFYFSRVLCSPVSVSRAAGQKGKQTQQATVVDLFIRAPVLRSGLGPPTQGLTNKHQSLAHVKIHRCKCVNPWLGGAVFVMPRAPCEDLQLCGNLVLTEKIRGGGHTLTCMMLQYHRLLRLWFNAKHLTACTFSSCFYIKFQQGLPNKFSCPLRCRHK